MQIVKDLMFAFYAVKALPKNSIEQLRHIIGIEKEKTQNQVIFELTNGDGLNTIFGEEHFTSRKKYI